MSDKEVFNNNDQQSQGNLKWMEEFKGETFKKEALAGNTAPTGEMESTFHSIAEQDDSILKTGIFHSENFVIHPTTNLLPANDPIPIWTF